MNDDLDPDRVEAVRHILWTSYGLATEVMQPDEGGIERDQQETRRALLALGVTPAELDEGERQGGMPATIAAARRGDSTGSPAVAAPVALERLALLALLGLALLAHLGRLRGLRLLRHRVGRR
jgi:hypothetical protein